MLRVENVWKTFNAGTVNEKTALAGLNLLGLLVPPGELLLHLLLSLLAQLRHRHRRQRSRKVHHAERSGRRMAGR